MTKRGRTMDVSVIEHIDWGKGCADRPCDICGADLRKVLQPHASVLDHGNGKAMLLCAACTEPYLTLQALGA